MFCNYVDMFKYVDSQFNMLPKWKKDAKEFTVSVNYNEDRGYQSSIPKPIMDALGEPDRVTFVISGDTVTISPAKRKLSMKERKRLI